MRIHQLINNEKEHKEFAWRFVKYYLNPPKSLWRDEDYPKLEPYFKWSNETDRKNRTPEIQASMEHYQKCCDEYANEECQYRDEVNTRYGTSIMEAFGLIPDYMDCYDHNEDGEPIDEDGKIIKSIEKAEDLTIDPEAEITYPFVFAGAIDNGFDRTGDYFMCVLDIVKLTDFSK